MAAWAVPLGSSSPRPGLRDDRDSGRSGRQASGHSGAGRSTGLPARGAPPAAPVAPPVATPVEPTGCRLMPPTAPRATDPTMQRRTPPAAPDGTMPLADHLAELRNRLFKAVLAIAVGSVVAWFFYAQIFSFIDQPFVDIIDEACANGQNVQLALTGVVDPFVLHCRSAWWPGCWFRRRSGCIRSGASSPLACTTTSGAGRSSSS